MRATLTKVLTKDAFARMIPAAERWTTGVEKAIAEFGVPWHVTRLGCRAEYQFSPQPPKNGAQAHDAMDFELERFMHLYAMNRGILLTPFHNMALMSPQTDPSDVDQHTRVFREALKELVGIVPSVTLLLSAADKSGNRRNAAIRLEFSDGHAGLRRAGGLRHSRRADAAGVGIGPAGHRFARGP